jgi:hypothetical protein
MVIIVLLVVQSLTFIIIIILACFYEFDLYIIKKKRNLMILTQFSIFELVKHAMHYGHTEC